MLKVFIGYDPVETVAWHTAVQSIIETSSEAVCFVPVNIRNLKGVYWRDRDEKQSNEFSFTRFLVPHLANYEGWALFMDCDMMVRCDLVDLFKQCKQMGHCAVHVVKHTYEPRDDIKYLDTVQYSYPRKNWSSFVLWNCSHPKNRLLTPDFVNTASGLELHRFTWLDDDDIGELDMRWNWLVGEYEDPPEDVKNVHWTLGGPYFREYSNVDFSDEWKALYERAYFCLQKE